MYTVICHITITGCRLEWLLTTWFYVVCQTPARVCDTWQCPGPLQVQQEARDGRPVSRPVSGGEVPATSTGVSEGERNAPCTQLCLCLLQSAASVWGGAGALIIKWCIVLVSVATHEAKRTMVVPTVCLDQRFLVLTYNTSGRATLHQLQQCVSAAMLARVS